MSRPKIRLRWAGSISAQASADKAYAKLKASQPLTKQQRKKKKRRPKRRRARMLAAKSPGPAGPKYHEYIVSAEWKAKSRTFIASRGKCEICGSIRQLQSHHKHYYTLGFEEQDDIRVLCADCHAGEHDGKVVGVMDSTTREYLSMQF